MTATLTVKNSSSPHVLCNVATDNQGLCCHGCHGCGQ